MQEPLYLGIDLGTTNSAATVFHGEQLLQVRGAQGDTLTPSVIRIDARGSVTVGSRAYRFLHKDPNNTRGEFKRLMGTSHRLTFPASALEFSPEQLAAKVLGSLKQDVRSQFGIDPQRAVIAVPALFELPQIAATSEAARLAGFERIETIQEPVASAMAAGWSKEHGQGAWLVYDLGGGTFDASLLETQEGLLRVVGHDGDNFLGGRDFDLRIVDWLIERLRIANAVNIQRSNPAHAMAVAQLKALAEEAKIELSRGATQTTIVIENLRVDDTVIDWFEEPITQAEVVQLTQPLIDQSLRVCDRLLRTHGIRKLERVVLVGGPTMMPWLQSRIEETLSTPVGTGLDPMLLVSQGAALFAATAALDARPSSPKPSELGPRLWLQYPAMTSDLSPYVVGRLLDADAGIKEVRFTRTVDHWQSDWLALEADGTFASTLALKRRASSNFKVEVQLKNGSILQANPGEITIVHGISIGDPPLARTIGVAKADNSVAVYFERGAPLPMRKTFSHRTVENISPSSTDFALRVPIVQGDFPLAHLCRLVGVIQIPASALKAPLPSGSAIELTIEVDRGGAMSARAVLPAQKLTFDHVEQLIAPATTPEKMSLLVVELERRAAAIRAYGFREGQRDSIRALAEFESTLSTIRSELKAACGGDPDAAEKARRAIIDADGMLGDVETANAWPELANRVYEEHATAISWLEQFGTETERRSLAQCMQFIERALRAKNSQEIERQLRTVRRLRFSAYLRDPDAYRYELDRAVHLVSSCSDPARAQKLVQRGRVAESAGDRRELERVVRELWTLFPVENETRSLGFDSGVL